MLNPSTSLACPLVSVIIPCYNHGAYLLAAFESVWQQEYPAVEVVVVDDGSTDTTKEVAQSHPMIKYIYQTNQGLSAARNTGIKQCTGQYLVFLDADDWLLPGALTINAHYLRQNAALAFVSGGHDKVFTATGVTVHEMREVTGNHYHHLLCGNYIGMHATVMFQRWVFEAFHYDPTLKACEDYDLVLRIARVYPVAHHTQRVAAYRLHRTNMSGNIPLMLSTVLAVHARQREHLQSAPERQAYARGQKIWRAYYTQELYQQLTANTAAATPAELVTLATSNIPLLIRYFLHPQARMLKNLLKNHAPLAIKRLLYKAGTYKSFRPGVGRLALGDFARTTPFSNEFGYDRGGPIDRYYIENFLRQEGKAIRGRVLEIGDNDYTLRFGADITQSDILHVDASNPSATFVGDLSNAPHIPDNLFDCVVLTQTLHLIYNYQQALATCYRILKPGGSLLLTVPGITPIDRGEWRKTWYWSFTDSALQRLLADTFPTGTWQINSYGNVFIASAFLYGMGKSEVTQGQLDYYDPQFQVINTVKAVKASNGG